MNVLLVAINAKYIHTNPAVYSLAFYAKNHGFSEQPEVAEYTINEPREQILRDIYKRQPDFVGISCYIWNMETVAPLLKELHTVLPNTALWVGGPEVSYHPEIVAERFPFLSGIMCGEGESVFTEILKEYEDSILSKAATPSAVQIRTAASPLNMDDLPFIYEDYDDLAASPFANKILYYESSRGCPYRCAYCLSSIEKSMRFRSLTLVERELQFFLDRKVPQVKFIDRTFNADKERAYHIWEFIKNHDNGITNFHFEIAGDILTEKQIALLNTMRPGLVQLEIGVQTTCEETLDAIDRHADFDVIFKNVLGLSKAKNIHLHLDLIAGLPFEGFQRFTESFDSLFKLQPNELQLGFLKVLKGTKIEECANLYNISYQSTPPYEVLATKWLSFAELSRLKDVEEMLELYYNSQQFLNTLRVVVPLFSRPFVFFDELAKYYEAHHLLLIQSSRSYRYEVLYQFLKETLPAVDDRLLRELLTYDYLLRERPKKVLPFFHQKEYTKFTYTVWVEEVKRLEEEAEVKVKVNYEKKNPVSGNFERV